MLHSLTYLSRQAKDLRKAVQSGQADAITRVHAVLGMRADLKHADFLHVIAREQGFDSWPRLKFAIEQAQMDRAAQIARLERALYEGQHWVAEALLAQTPDLAQAHIGIELALGDIAAVETRLARDPGAATREISGRRAILHLAFSKAAHRKEGREDGTALAALLVAHGADVNDSYEGAPGARLSALYGALGHARNLPLARWLLEYGASPDDNESLYHATELDTLEGLRLMLEFGATIAGTNALARMLDFDNAEGARLLLEAGADPNEGAAPHPSGQPAYGICALHHGARRRCGPEIAQLLLDHGADAQALQYGHSAYALARMYGNTAYAQVLERAGQHTDLSASEAAIAAALEGQAGAALSARDLSEEQMRLLCRLLGFEGTLPAGRRLIAMGLDPNQTEEMGMPALHIAGWQGQAEALAYLLTLNPDLSHKNSYGGDLMGTILHGAGYCPEAGRRDHLRCAALALEAGMMLHRADIPHCAHAGLRDWLRDWAEAHPDRVI